jgi:hypothetical protein
MSRTGGQNHGLWAVVLHQWGIVYHEFEEGRVQLDNVTVELIKGHVNEFGVAVWVRMRDCFNYGFTDATLVNRLKITFT